MHPEEEEKLVAQLMKNEVPAEFPGGEEAWNKYLRNNLRMPKALENENIKGELILKFVITTTGKVDNVEVIKSLNSLLDGEVVRVIKNSPRWRPAKQNGKKVTATRTQPITL